MSYSRDIFNRPPQAYRRRDKGHLATKKGKPLKGKRFSKYVSRLMKRRNVSNFKFVFSNKIPDKMNI